MDKLNQCVFALHLVLHVKDFDGDDGNYLANK